MKITLNPERLAAALRATSAGARSGARSARRLPGEPRPFRPLVDRSPEQSSVRNLVPQQTLQAGQITSGRPHEVTRGIETLLHRIDQLEHQLAASKTRRIALVRERNAARRALENLQESLEW